MKPITPRERELLGVVQRRDKTATATPEECDALHARDLIAVVPCPCGHCIEVGLTASGLDAMRCFDALERDGAA